MCREIDIALKDGDTLGGIFEVVVNGIPPGLGSHTQWDRRLDANLARAIMSIQAIKGVGFGMGFEAAASAGSKVHDEIFYSKANGYFRKTNNAGGLEGGMTNGEDIIIHAAMKPISTLKRPLASVNIRTKRPASASVERSDVCAVPAAGVVGEAVVAIEIANAMMEKFGGDSVEEMRRNFEGYMIRVKRF
jgi:chorismate synthase